MCTALGGGGGCEEEMVQRQVKGERGGIREYACLCAKQCP